MKQRDKPLPRTRRQLEAIRYQEYRLGDGKTAMADQLARIADLERRD